MAYRNKLEEACTTCSKPTNEECDHCQRPFDSGCLFKTGQRITLPSDPRNEDYAERPTWQRDEELCMACYTQKMGHAPLVLFGETASEVKLSPRNVIAPGVSVPAGDGAHHWYAPAKGADILHLQWGYQTQINYDAFHTLQLLEFLKANEQIIRNQVKAASEVLLPQARRDTERAIRADQRYYEPLDE